MPAAKRRHLDIAEKKFLAQQLQVLALQGIMRSRRWSDSEIRFQGGTCLNLVHDTGRFSEDIDFLVSTQKGFDRIMSSAKSWLTSSLAGSNDPGTIEMKVRGETMDNDPRNPRMATFTYKHPDYLEAIHVKVEFFVADIQVVDAYRYEKMPLRPLRSNVTVTIRAEDPELRAIPSATLNELWVDKVHAIATRPYTKYRDFYDLWWLEDSVRPSNRDAVQAERVEHIRKVIDGRLLMYPHEGGLPALVSQLGRRIDDLAKPEILKGAMTDIQRWVLRGDLEELCRDEKWMAKLLNTCVTQLKAAHQALSDECKSAPPQAPRKQTAAKPQSQSLVTARSAYLPSSPAVAPDDEEHLPSP
jgi:predicted nucleotidyltransferase component of viral defense system